LDYLAKCAGDDCTSVSAGDLSFFKIDAKGLNDAASQNWASDDLIKDGNSWTVTVPEDIAPGQYVLRHEIIALHSAQDANGAQNYPQCINIEVTGSGTAEPAGVAATELYTAKDAGISLSIYNGLTDYEIPGPAVYSGGASSGSAPKPSSAAASSAAATSAAASSVAPSSAAVTSAAPQQTEEASSGSDSGSDSSAPCTTTITITGSAPAATATATEVATETATATATASGTPVDTSSDDSSDYPEESAPSTTAAAPAISAVASSLPSSVLDAPIPTATSSTDKEDGRPAKALPEGFTLNDLLEWVNYLISKAYNSDGKHARDVTRR
jgi:cellulase